MTTAVPLRRVLQRGVADHPRPGAFRVLAWRDEGHVAGEWWVEGDDHATLDDAMAVAIAIHAGEAVATQIVDHRGGKLFHSPLSDRDKALLRRPRAVTALVERAFGLPRTKTSPTYKRN